MKELRQAFISLNGREFTAEEFHRELKRIHRENLRSIPLDLRTEDLYEYAQMAEWLQENSGRVAVHVS